MSISRWVALVAIVSASATPGAVGSSAHAAVPLPELCAPVAASHPHPAHRLRVGIDPGAAGNPLPSTEAPKPINRASELHALTALRPANRVLVVRLNRLFWSGGGPLLQHFARQARHLGRHGFKVEVQVRYHPTKLENGDISAWTAWVRHVTSVLGRNPALVALTITNEVNFTISPNTSDGTYKRAKDALIRGIEASSRVLHRRHWAHRIALGFTFAYRLNPTTDAGLFTYLKMHGGPRFRRALGFVGLDDYPGTVYPPALAPGTSAGDELAGSIATLRRCYLPLAGIGRRTPIWITENGFGSNAPLHTEAKQAAALRSMVNATRRYAGTYNVTDYRWFNLRDNASHGSGLFDQDGLLRDNYAPKPSFEALRAFIRHHGRRTGSGGTTRARP